MTWRALIIGLVYVLLWEGALGGLLEGTKFLSIRQATLGIVAGLGGEVDTRRAAPDRGRRGRPDDRRRWARSSCTSWRLARFEVRAGDSSA